MEIHSAMLLSDWLMWALVLIVFTLFLCARNKLHFREAWRQILRKKLGVFALVVLLFYITVGLLDCIHLQFTTTQNQSQAKIQAQSQGQAQPYQTSFQVKKIKSVLDLLLGPISEKQEKTYSKPFATHLYTQSIVTLANGKEVRRYARLKYAGMDLKHPNKDKAPDIIKRSLLGLFAGALSFAVLASTVIFLLSRRRKKKYGALLRDIIKGETKIAWREAMITFGILWILIFIAGFLVSEYHIFGTDKIGQDVFYQTIKSIRTGLVIGTLTTLFMLPFSLALGTMAGYFHGWVDDIIQYIYTTLSSIPGVLLISASILVLQVYINNHPDLFPNLMQRADARLIALCIILGVTSWAGLCRLLRGETLKLRELDFIQASRALGVKHRNIIFQHILPNVMHIVIITMALDFSMLVLAEAVLSYVGVGVDPTTLSWGNMINSSRLELAREPIIWWPLLASLIFMFLLVLAANLFADAIRDALDPHLRNLEE